MEKPFVVGCVGLPSAGKSSFVNSIAGKRILQTGVARTTKEVHCIGRTNLLNFKKDCYHSVNLMSDDGVPFVFIDLPGVADAEDRVQGNEKTFDELTEGWATNCDLILWVSDISTAFLTTHEKKEFDKIKARLDQATIETGTLYQTGILLSKFDHSDVESEPQSHNTRAPPKYQREPATPKREESVDSCEEIDSDEEEDTTIRDCYKRVESLFRGTATPIFKFNAFGRCLHKPNISTSLRNFVKKQQPHVSDANVDFNLSWATSDIDRLRQRAILKSIFHKQLPDIIADIQNPRSQQKLKKLQRTLQSYHKRLAEFERQGESYRQYIDQTRRAINTVEEQIRQLEKKGSLQTLDKSIKKLTDCRSRSALVDFLFSTSSDGVKAVTNQYSNVSLTYCATSWNIVCSKLGKRDDFQEFLPAVEQRLLKFAKPDLLYRVNALFGAETLLACRMYLNIISEHCSTSSNDNCFGSPSNTRQRCRAVSTSTAFHSSTSFVEPRGLEAVDPTIHHPHFKLDVAFSQNRSKSCYEAFLAQVKKARQELWGEAPGHVNIPMLCMNVWHGNVPSLLVEKP